MKTYKTREEAAKEAIGSDRIMKTREGWIVVDYWDRNYDKAEQVKK